jgi:hypothetical protein
MLLSGGNGTTIDLKDKAGHIYGHLDIGALLGAFQATNLDPKVLF